MDGAGDWLRDMTQLKSVASDFRPVGLQSLRCRPPECLGTSSRGRYTFSGKSSLAMPCWIPA